MNEVYKKMRVDRARLFASRSDKPQCNIDLVIHVECAYCGDMLVSCNYVREGDAMWPLPEEPSTIKISGPCRCRIPTKEKVNAER